MMTIKKFVFTSALIGSALASSACMVGEDEIDDEYDDDDEFEGDKLRAGTEPDELPDPAAADDEESSLAETVRDEATGQVRSGPADSRKYLQCLAVIADAAYMAGDPGPISCLGGATATYERQYSTEVMKVWRWGTQSLIVSFKGTRILNLGDDVRDLQNIFKSKFTSQLQPNVTYPGWLGAGWLARWSNQAPRLKPGLEAIVRQHAMDNKKPVQLIVTGHSMGGALAAVAGYDAAKYLNTKKLKSRGVFVYAFNPPKVGTRTMMDNYGAALFNRKSNRLFYRQFIRYNDPVHHMGPGLHHPVWNRTPLSRQIGTGALAKYSLSYCPMYVAPAYGGKLSSHSMSMWHQADKKQKRDADTLTMPGNHAVCMDEGIF